ncbi:MAG: translocation/assembly module TamB domain-containing protein [Gemmatimonadales bacterium]|nr:translocation/assembly module TamB domain-containing protein [Gemmatimonadales bacterium]
MRWLKRITAGLAVPPTVIVATILGTVAALIWSPPGRALSARLATDLITASVDGRVEIGAIRGNVINHLVLENVRITDSSGAPVVEAPRIEVRYLLPELLAGRIVFSELRADRPVIHLVKLRSGYWNYEKIFRVRKGDTTATRPPQLVELHDVTLRDATIRIDVPTTPRPPRPPISRHARTPAQARNERGVDGPVRVYELTNTSARLSLVRVSTPDRDPLLIRIDELRTNLSDPALTITSAEGEIITAADSVRFTFAHADMPGTSVRGGGAIRWPRDTVLFDFALDADTVDLRDLRWVSPDFPAWQGKGRVEALSRSGSRTDYTLTNLVLGADDALAVGRLVAVVDNKRGLGMRDLDLTLRNVPLDVARPYLDTLPFRGPITGRIRADGFLDRMELGGDLVLADALVSGMPRSRFIFNGAIRFGGANGAVFERFRLTDSDIDLRTVQRLVPAVVIPGDLRLTGVLDGPWLNARFEGVAVHVPPNGARSRMNGSVRFDARGTVLALALDATFPVISFDGLRTGYPSLTPVGSLAGRVTAFGPITDLDLLADLEGEIGVVHARGRLGLDAPRLSANGMVVDVERLDLRALLGRGEPTSLNGRITATGVIDPVAPPIGTLDVALTPSSVGGIEFTSVLASVAASGGLVRVDTAAVSWPDGTASASGSIGWAAPSSGTLSVELATTSLAPFDSLVRAMTGFAPDTVNARTFDGTGTASLELTGSLDHLDISGTFAAQHVLLDNWYVANVSGDIRADSLGARGIAIDATIDTLLAGAQLMRDISFTAAGRSDSLALAGKADVGLATFSGGGRWETMSTISTIELDSLTMGLPRQDWSLVRPVTFSIRDGLIVLSDTLMLRTPDGSGAVTASGTVPGESEGELRASIVGLNLADVFAVLYSDSLLGSGLASLDFRLAGTKLLPTLRGNLSVTGPVLGDVRPPMLRGAFDYRAQRLRSNLAFWKTGEQVLEIDLSLPFDLALTGRPTRRLPGPIEVTALADSADLSLLEAFTPSIRNARGVLKVDMHGSGTWDSPRLDGTVAIVEGRMTLPDLGVRYGPINGVARFSGDSLVIDTLAMSSGDGLATVSGSLRFRDLASPELDLRITSRGFLAVDVVGFMKMRPTGEVTLRGPLNHPVMRGTPAGIFIEDSDIYFADLLTKNVINLDDPVNAAFVDTLALRTQGLSARFQSRFLDSLRIDPINVQIGTDVWLKSGEANIQLEGDVTAQKLGQEYGLIGNLNTPRGTYTVKILAFNIDFDVQRGSVRYFGTPDLNAALDILATNTVRTQDGDEILIQAQIGGTILVPTLKLTAPGRNIPERDLISYLVFGRPEFDVASSGESQALQLAIGALATETERVLVNDLGLGVETIQIRPGGVPGQGSSFTTIAIGRQFGDKWYVTGNVGVCFGQRANGFGARNFGASVEYRFARNWRVQASAEPVQACSSNRASDLLTNLQGRYQLGADLLWEREY